MSIKDLVKHARNLPVRRVVEHPIASLQNEMNRLFGDFWSSWDIMPTMNVPALRAGFSPRVNIEETPSAVTVTAELPGMDDKNVKVEIHGNVLTLSGEKQEEHREKKKECVRYERSYGSFRRTLALPGTVNEKKAAATFKKGVLTITLPKTAAARPAGRQIAVKSN
jgi:HSP20 family protein